MSETENADVVRELYRYQWLEWWLRNAAEMTRADPIRPHLLRLALSAHLAPSLERFQADMEKLASDEDAPALERSAAKAFVDELGQEGEPPWVRWQRETGEPTHNAYAQKLAYAQARKSWAELLKGADRIPSIPPTRQDA